MAVPEISQTYELAEFAHLLDVSVGVNLAYSLLEQVHSTWTNKYRDMVAKSYSECESLVEPGSDGVAVNDYLKSQHNKKLEKCELFSSKVVRIMRVWGFLAAGALMLILGGIGFDPDIEVRLCVINTLLALLVAPIPFSSTLLLIYWKHKVQRARNKLNERLAEINANVSSAKEKLGITK